MAAPAELPVPAPAPAAPVVVAAADSAALEQTCRDAFGRKKYKDILDSCGRAFEARPAAADLAVLVAETELDRGRAGSALTWARKAVAADPNMADAYVFIGTAEQQSGHAQAARTAYLKYLELAPAGRYAQDLKSIVGNH
jgi:Flp pilus assembly protein TadD